MLKEDLKDYSKVIELPKNHPFIQFEVSEANGNALVFIGFKNIQCGNRTFYDTYGTSTTMGILPTAILDSPEIGRSVMDSCKDTLPSVLMCHFLSDIIHRDTIQERETMTLYKDGEVDWLAVAHFIDLFVHKLFFLKFMVANTDKLLRVKIEPRSGMVDLYDNSNYADFQSVIIDFDKADLLDYLDEFSQVADEDATNNMFKNYIFNRFAYWFYNLKKPPIKIKGLKISRVSSNLKPTATAGVSVTEQLDKIANK